MPLRFARTCIQSLVEIILPMRCSSCNALLHHAIAAPEHIFCRACVETLEPVVDPCQQCGQSHQHPLCATCYKYPAAFSGVVAHYIYGGQLAPAIARFKFEGQTHLARPLAWLMTPPPRTLTPSDLVVPVPLHPARLRERGFNQAALLARHVAKRYTLQTCYSALRRLKNTEPQVFQGRDQRGRNLQGAFAARRSHVAGRTILLIDDVFTTGSTARAGAEALRSAGAGDVIVWVIARTEV